MKEFKTEHEFEEAVIKKLTEEMNQWDPNTLNYKTEEELILNWRTIIEKNNSEKDRLNNTPLTNTEMKQVLDVFNKKKTPFLINQFLNGDASVIITRDNPDDKLHYNKKISLKLFDKNHNAGGNTVYQIARQPIFKTNYIHLNNERGDFILLINGMPLIHIELKNDSYETDKLKEAIFQIKRYKQDICFNGFFSLIQVFVAMTPTEMKYFANVDSYELFNDRLMFHWADEKNEYINNWQDICKQFLSIPMAHNLISFYSVADETDQTLKILRSYQCIAVKKIFDIVSTRNWQDSDVKCGYIYHTTGSGKTLTCFKVAQLLSSLTPVDKIVFLLDAVQLYQQTYENFVSFSNTELVEDTKNINELVNLLNSSSKEEKIIITSIQKMKELTDVDEETNKYQKFIDSIKKKKIVFIVDEAHRSTNGSMLADIKNTYKNSLLFGFTGTPIFEKNARDRLTTVGLFGPELHRYTMLSAIKDGNVLEVKNVENITTYDVDDMKCKLAAIQFEPNSTNYYNYLEKTDQLALETNFIGPLKEHYNSDEHKKKVIEDIIKNFDNRSHNRFFHHILATTSITNAIQYYHLFKTYNTDINVAITFDDSETNDETSIFKNNAIDEIIRDYRAKYKINSITDFKGMKKNIISKLKEESTNKDTRIDLVIVVDQLLTGFDSKYINYVYLDKVMEYERLIQTASRTNRILNHKEENKKRYGFLKCYQRSALMKKNLEEAAALFISPEEANFFNSKLKENLLLLNKTYDELVEFFEKLGIKYFTKLPEDKKHQEYFAHLFARLKTTIDKVIPELFSWKQKTYFFDKNLTDFVEVKISKEDFNKLQQRFKELPKEEREKFEVYIDIEPDFRYTNGYSLDKENLSLLIVQYNNKHKNNIEDSNSTIEKIEERISILSNEEQQIIYDLLNKIKAKQTEINENFDVDKYINNYKSIKEQEMIVEINQICGASIELLTLLLNRRFNDPQELLKTNEFDQLKNSIDKNKTSKNFKEILGREIALRHINIKLSEYFKEFLTGNNIDIITWIKNNVKE